jgi:hypothetical protein
VIRRFGHVVLAELDKLRTLPAAVVTLTGTVLAAVALSHTADVVPYLQPGLVLMGSLPVIHEYAGRQLSTSLVAVPARGLLLAGKTLAALTVVGLTAAVSLAAASLTWTGFTRLTLVGILAYAVALLVHHLVPALAGTLTVVLLLPPVLPQAHWLPTTHQLTLAWIVIVGSVAGYRFQRRD